MSRIKQANGRDAIDVMTKDIKDHEERKGKIITDSEARRRATEIAYRAEKRTVVRK